METRPSQINAPAGKASEFYSELAERIAKPGKKKDKLPLYDWTMRYRRFDGMPPEISPWLEDIYRDEHPNIVIMKAAQIGISEFGINKVLWASDQKWADRGVSLYVFPKQEQMDDFSQDRVTRAVQGSMYLKERMGQTDIQQRTDRTRLRKIGGSPIYFRGSDSVMQTRSIDADVVVLDEVDLFREGAVDRVKERMGSSLAPLFAAFSQPLYPGGPVDKLYEGSDMRHYYLKCEHCNDWQPLTWDANVVFDIPVTSVRVQCRKCHEPIDRLARGEWVADNPGHYVHGYQVSKLYSARANLIDMAIKFLNVGDPETVQSFYNADLGITFRPEGSPGLESFTKGFFSWNVPLIDNYMGVDVGRKLHVTVISRENVTQPFKTMLIRSVDTFQELTQLFEYFKIRLCVIDAQGDPRATREWASSPGRAGKTFCWLHKPGAANPKFVNDELHFHRTNLLDNLYSVLKAKPPRVILHEHAEPDFWSHLEGNIRELVKDNAGRFIVRYTPVKEDHYAFALAYAVVAAGVMSSDLSASMLHKGGSNDIETVEDLQRAMERQEPEAGYEEDRDWISIGKGFKWGRWRPG